MTKTDDQDFNAKGFIDTTFLDNEKDQRKTDILKQISWVEWSLLIKTMKIFYEISYVKNNTYTKVKDDGV